MPDMRVASAAEFEALSSASCFWAELSALRAAASATRRSEYERLAAAAAISAAASSRVSAAAMATLAAASCVRTTESAPAASAACGAFCAAAAIMASSGDSSLSTRADRRATSCLATAP
eukprot:scaffold1437_cov353-Prasinococcus_capsulatus_cf.AAC.3